MAEQQPFASLSPTLLARKGGARPAMRRPDAVLAPGGSPVMPPEDLGWNDWGRSVPASPRQSGGAITGNEMPEVLRQLEQLAWRINQTVVPVAEEPAHGRRAAFTLRLDAERHFRLRMASLVLDRSAQTLVTDALDRYLSDIPEVARLPRGTDA